MVTTTEDESMFGAVVGLGNPGAEYADTRHNVGFMVVDEVVARLAASRWQDQGPNMVSVARIGGNCVWIAKPTTYMNRSGLAVGALADETGVEIGQLLVVVDDVDLPFGRLRMRGNGGPGTHNGLRDVVELLGTGFARLRVGVGPRDPVDDLADFVLSPFSESEQEEAGSLIGRAADAVVMALERGLKPAMDQFNRAEQLEPKMSDSGG